MPKKKLMQLLLVFLAAILIVAVILFVHAQNSARSDEVMGNVNPSIVIAPGAEDHIQSSNADVDNVNVKP